VTAPSHGGQESGWADVAEHLLPDLEARLIARFSPPLRPEAVQRCLGDVIAHFDTARVKTYLAVLIERRATDRLRAAVADADRAATGRRIAEVKPRGAAPAQLVARAENH
jgi:hypothetical protein